jgi:hypothetical protein
VLRPPSIPDSVAARTVPASNLFFYPSLSSSDHRMRCLDHITPYLFMRCLDHITPYLFNPSLRPSLCSMSITSHSSGVNNITPRRP